MRLDAAPFDWTPERVSTLTRLWAEGASASEVARELGSGVGRNAVICKVHRLKLPKRRTISRTYPVPKPRRLKKVLSPRVPKMKPMRLPSPSPLSDMPIDPQPVNAKAWEPLPGTVPVALVDLERDQCKWPCGEAPFVFCGQPALADHPYCEHHTRRAAGPPPFKIRVPRQ